MKLKEIAERINAHLKRFERDPKINKHDKYGSRFYFAGASAAGRWVNVVYITYQGHSHLTKAEAERYLAWLDKGHVGRHHEALVK